MEYLHSQVYHFGKLFQACKAAAEELFREERGNELQRDLREMMGGGWKLSYLIHCFTPSELYLTTKRSDPPALVLPSSPPSVYPVT